MYTRIRSNKWNLRKGVFRILSNVDNLSLANERMKEYNEGASRSSVWGKRLAFVVPNQRVGRVVNKRAEGVVNGKIELHGGVEDFKVTSVSSTDVATLVAASNGASRNASGGQWKVKCSELFCVSLERENALKGLDEFGKNQGVGGVGGGVGGGGGFSSTSNIPKKKKDIRATGIPKKNNLPPPHPRSSTADKSR